MILLALSLPGVVCGTLSTLAAPAANPTSSERIGEMVATTSQRETNPKDRALPISTRRTVRSWTVHDGGCRNPGNRRQLDIEEQALLCEVCVTIGDALRIPCGDRRARIDNNCCRTCAPGTLDGLLGRVALLNIDQETSEGVNPYKVDVEHRTGLQAVQLRLPFHASLQNAGQAEAKGRKSETQCRANVALSIALNHRYRDERQSAIGNPLEMDAYSLIDIRVGVKLDNGMCITPFAANVTNEIVVHRCSSAAHARFQHYAIKPPRTVGLRASYSLFEKSDRLPA